jgi:hypothetical protein
MHAELLFSIANYVALLGWALLIVIPAARVTRVLVIGLAIPLLLAALYVALIVFYIGQAEGGFGSLIDVALLFQHPHILLAGWVHYLCFDLLIGVWENYDGLRNGIPRWIVAPCQILTFFLGPAGLLAYVLIRTIYSRNFAHEFPAAP